MIRFQQILKVLLRASLFALYLVGFSSLVLYLLLGVSGAVLGGFIGFCLLFLMSFQGTERIRKKMGALTMGEAQLSELYYVCRELCRRMQLPTIKLAVIPSPAINAAAFGFTLRNTHLALTEGALTKLTRGEQIALLNRLLFSVKNREVFLASWLAQFLSLLQPRRFFIRLHLLPEKKVTPTHTYTFAFFVRQAILFPLTLIPRALLSYSPDISEGDLASLTLQTEVSDLTQALRKMEQNQNRHSQLRVGNPDLSLRHLYFAKPSTSDPLTRLFYPQDNLSSRIQWLEMNLKLRTATR